MANHDVITKQADSTGSVVAAVTSLTTGNSVITIDGETATASSASITSSGVTGE